MKLKLLPIDITFLVQIIGNTIVEKVKKPEYKLSFLIRMLPNLPPKSIYGISVF